MGKHDHIPCHSRYAQSLMAFPRLVDSVGLVDNAMIPRHLHM